MGRSQEKRGLKKDHDVKKKKRRKIREMTSNNPSQKKE